MNIQKEIETKCKDSYNVFEYQKNYHLKDKKDSSNLKDFFSRTFTIDPKKRITLNEMFSHYFFQTVDAESTSDSIDDQLEQDVEQ